MGAQITDFNYSFRGFTLSAGSRELCSPSGKVIKLSSRAFDVLLELVRNRGQVVSKEHLMEVIWPNVYVEENNINQAVRIIRKGLGDSNNSPEFIQTVQGRGYCFIAEVVVVTQADSCDSPETAPGVPADAGEELGMSPDSPVSAGQNHVAGYSKSYGLGLLAVILLVVTGAVYYTPETAVPEGASSALPATAAEIPTEVRTAVVPDSILVMPLVNLNPEAETDLFASGMHDELISHLIKINSLKVISRDSVLSLSASGSPVSEIAHLLNVESVMTGTIIFLAERARVSLQVLNAESGFTLWAESYEFDTGDLPGMVLIQNQIAMDVAKALEVEIQPHETTSLAALPTNSFEAYRFYLAARNAHRHQEENEKWLLVKKALELDPDFAEAQLYFASINSLLTTNHMEGMSSEEHLNYMFSSLEEYIRLKPERSEGYSLKAVALGMQRDWDGVGRQLDKLDELGASYAERKYIALILLCLGDFEQAIRIYEESLLTEPVNLYSRGLLMAALEMSGNPARARKEFVLGNELKSSWWGDSVNALLAMGRREPLVELEDASNLSPELVRVLSGINNEEAVRQGIQDYLANMDKESSEGIYYSALAAYYGDTATANALLRSAMEDVSTSIFWAWLPVFEQVRQTGEFRQILVDFGLVAYWKEHGWPRICQPQDDSFTCS